MQTQTSAHYKRVHASSVCMHLSSVCTQFHWILCTERMHAYACMHCMHACIALAACMCCSFCIHAWGRLACTVSFRAYLCCMGCMHAPMHARLQGALECMHAINEHMQLLQQIAHANKSHLHRQGADWYSVHACVETRLHCRHMHASRTCCYQMHTYSGACMHVCMSACMHACKHACKCRSILLSPASHHMPDLPINNPASAWPTRLCHATRLKGRLDIPPNMHAAHQPRPV